MDDTRFAALCRAIGSATTRRGALAALAGLLGLGLVGPRDVAGKSKEKRRQQRRRKHQERRKHKHDAQGLNRGIKMTVGNPLTNMRAFAVELGYGWPSSSSQGGCCQGAAGYTLQPGETEWFATAETTGYLWVENRYFISFDNPAILLPFLGWAIDGVTFFYAPSCCKPRGETLNSRYGMDVGETKVLDFNGRLISVQRLEDEDDYKSFFISL